MDQVVEHYFDVFTDASLEWEDLEFLRSHTDLPIVLKGIVHPDDAQKAIEHGADGILVSNHGGRQLDGEVGALDALPDVVDTVNGRIPVLFDSGIRRGADAYKAIALGADAVGLGRPYIYALAIDGSSGVRDLLRNFLGDLDVTLGLSGHTSFDAVDDSTLRKR
jgi:isopentenyl diphosphate isomerase/L-lactate dehydrogenase-like FMN-dependent dehydrogenase